MQKITPFLWFNDNAEEAIDFYASVFKNSRIVYKTHLPELRPNGKKTLFTGTIEIEGQQLMVMNGGPHYQLSPAVSLFVNCKDQAEVDYFWEKLTADGGQESRCGWLTDKFGLSWQIIPEALGRLMHDRENPEKANRAMQAMSQMVKIDVAKIEAAYNGTDSVSA